MDLKLRALPWWFVAACGLLLAACVVPVALNRQPPVVLVVVASGVLGLLLARTRTLAGAVRLERQVSPSPLFTLDIDPSSRAEAGIEADDAAFHAVATDVGLELWTVERNPHPASVIGWATLETAGVDVAIHRQDAGTVALEHADGRAIYLGVRRGGAALLAQLIEARLSAQPDTARTQPPVQSD